MKQPKPFLNKLKARHRAKGTERRLNMTKTVLENSVSFPKGVELKDIDEAFEVWVRDELDLSFEGKKLPTYKLFSNQRINEYAQTWNQLDENGNLLMNFKTITRDNNPKHGENQGSWYNIPGNRDYPMFVIPVLQENGLQAFDIYSMKQPYSLDIEYSVTLVSNKYELLNEMNQKVNYQFKAINAYISPNGHYMPMTLEDVADESEYAVDDRKYYAQTYKIKIMAYIIHEEDFKVTHQPGRMMIRMLDGSDLHKNKREDSGHTTVQIEERCPRDYPSIGDEQYDAEHRYIQKELIITIKFDLCTQYVDFTMDTDMVITVVEMDNIAEFKLFVNDEQETFSNELTNLYVGDKIHIDVKFEDILKPMTLIISGYDPHTIVDVSPENESSLDDDLRTEEIEIQ